MPDTKIISFRVDERHYALLSDRSAALGQSVGELSRQLVLEGLLGAQVTVALEQSLRESRLEVMAVLGGVREFRADFIAGLKALLVTAGKVSPSEVDAWIESNLGEQDA